MVPGGPADLNVDALVQFCFRAPERPIAPTPSAGALPAPRHLYGLGQDREDVAIERWMFGHCEDLLAALGLPFGWWCGLWLVRDEVFADGDHGDLDLLAGPLDFDFDHDELEARVRDETRRRPLAQPPSLIRNSAIMRAAREGHVVWPPSMDTVVECEVKASYYDHAGWHRTHVGDRVGVMGQLQYVRRHGVDRVALLHLGATTPRGSGPENPVLTAAKDVSDALASLPRIFDPAELPDCGYFAGLFGAMERAEEWFEGVNSGLVVAQQATLNPLANRAAAWRERLRERLAALPRPTSLRTFVQRCDRCKGWRHAASATDEWSPCPCPKT
ncbi:MAG: hypothetical protein ACRELB_20735 [Polyangiaceae bacterium]